MAKLEPGTLWGGRYRIEGYLGSGFSCDTYRVEGALALKLFKAEVGAGSVNQLVCDYFLRRCVRHPAIVPMLSMGASPSLHTVAPVAALRGVHAFLAEQGLPAQALARSLLTEMVALHAGLQQVGVCLTEYGFRNVLFTGDHPVLLDFGRVRVADGPARRVLLPLLGPKLQQADEKAWLELGEQMHTALFSLLTGCDSVQIVISIVRKRHGVDLPGFGARRARPELGDVADMIDAGRGCTPLQWAERIGVAPVPIEVQAQPAMPAALSSFLRSPRLTRLEVSEAELAAYMQNWPDEMEVWRLLGGAKIHGDLDLHWTTLKTLAPDDETFELCLDAALARGRSLLIAGYDEAVSRQLPEDTRVLIISTRASSTSSR